MDSSTRAWLEPSKRVQRLVTSPRFLRQQHDRPQEPIIDLSIGDPDLAPPAHLLDALLEAIRDDRQIHSYPVSSGSVEFREAIAKWFLMRFGVALDPEREVSLVVGTKEGIAHLGLALLDPGDYALIPDPGYPAYRSACLLAGARPIVIPLDRKAGYSPDFRAVKARMLAKSRLLFLNYPNNPTGAVADCELYSRVLEVAEHSNFVVCNDATYAEIIFGELLPTTLLKVRGPDARVIEFHSFSKTFGIPGWRIGFVAGNAKVVAALRAVKVSVDVGQFLGFQTAISKILGDGRTLEYIQQTRLAYERRRDLAVAALQRLECEIEIPRGTFYIWLRERDKGRGQPFSSALQRQGVVVSTGSVFGGCGEGHFRLSLTVGDDLIREAMRRVERVLKVVA